jgi:nicotinate-nucleotide--dimethylbenzimidazole phosphoribosyltransferase
MKLYEKTAAGIKPAYENSMKESAERLDKLVKPIGSLGKLEDLAIKISGITGKQVNGFEKKVTAIMASDNGVAEEGVSAAPQSVTS